MSPRPYRMVQRQAAADENRERILAAARALLLGKDFSDFSMEAVARKANVSRLTIYYQFDSKSGLLEALYDSIARSGHLGQLPEVFRLGNDPLQKLHNFIEVFVQFWASERDVIRRLHALGAIDSEIGQGLRARNERRRNGLRVILEHYAHVYHQFTPPEEPVVLDTLHMLTSFETFHGLAGNGRSADEVFKIIRKMADHAIGFSPRPISPIATPSLNLRRSRRRRRS
ncbi:MAG: TetR/AcrR family transcriptional regulator [Candidatus Sulfotelmatobacter sp.]